MLENMFAEADGTAQGAKKQRDSSSRQKNRCRIGGRGRGGCGHPRSISRRLETAVPVTKSEDDSDCRC